MKKKHKIILYLFFLGFVLLIIGLILGKMLGDNHLEITKTILYSSGILLSVSTIASVLNPIK